MKITEFKRTYNDMNSAIRAAKMFELRKQQTLSLWDGKYKQARNCQKEIAKIAIEDIETYKTLPFVNIKVQAMPPKEFCKLLLKSVKYRVYNAFSRKTPEEKQLKKECKSYFKNLSQEEIRKNTIDIVIPSLF